ITLTRLDNLPCPEHGSPCLPQREPMMPRGNKITEGPARAEYFNLLCWKPDSTCWRLVGSGLGAKASKEGVEQHGCKPEPGCTAHSTRPREPPRSGRGCRTERNQAALAVSDLDAEAVGR